VDAAHAFPVPAGEKGEAVGAALVVTEESAPSDDTIHEYCRDALPGYKRPAAVLLLSADQVPMTGSGKVQKGRLRARLLEEIEDGDATVARLF
jgi:acyl-CoA synthetase (AMP-forming)/AMP-acid ligase II